MTEVRDHAAALAGELADLHQQARLAGDHELEVELRPLDRLLRGSAGAVTVNAYATLANDIEAKTRKEIRAELAEKQVARDENYRRLLRKQLSKEAQAEAERALQEDRRQLDRAEEDVLAAALHLEARDATVTAREKTWTSHRNRAVAVGGSIVLALDLLARLAL